jgi:hypothetical protein
MHDIVQTIKGLLFISNWGHTFSHASNDAWQLLSSLNFEELANSRTKSKESNRANGVSYIPPPNAFWGPLARPKAKLGQDDSFDDAEESSIDNATLQTSQ